MAKVNCHWCHQAFTVHWWNHATVERCQGCLKWTCREHLTETDESLDLCPICIDQGIRRPAESPSFGAFKLNPWEWAVVSAFALIVLLILWLGPWR